MPFKVTSSVANPYGAVLEDGQPLCFTLKGSIYPKVNDSKFGKNVSFTPFDPDDFEKIQDKLFKVTEVMSDEYEVKPFITEQTKRLFFKLRKTLPTNNIGLAEDATDLINCDNVTVTFEVGHYIRKNDKTQGFYSTLKNVTGKTKKSK